MKEGIDCDWCNKSFPYVDAWELLDEVASPVLCEACASAYERGYEKGVNR